MIDFSHEISLIKKNLPTADPIDLQIAVSFAWNSSNNEHRLQIRQHILENHAKDVADQRLFLDLNLIPSLKQNSVSVSHSTSQGGYTFSSRKIGFDLIERSRLSEKVIKRVTTPYEIESAPEINYLWPAKEAVFKACSDLYNTITQFEVSLWENLGNNTYSFKLSNTDQNQHSAAVGFAFFKSEVFYAIYFR